MSGATCIATKRGLCLLRCHFRDSSKALGGGITFSSNALALSDGVGFRSVLTDSARRTKAYPPCNYRPKEGCLISSEVFELGCDELSRNRLVTSLMKPTDEPV
jgi:hypothetical protein